MLRRTLWRNMQMRRPVVKQGRGRSVAVAFFSGLWLRGWPIWRLPCWAWMRRKPLREDPPGVPVRADVRPVRAVVRHAPADPVAADRPVLGGVRHVPADPAGPAGPVPRVPADLAGPVPRVPAGPADPVLPVLADPADPAPRGPADLAGLVTATGVGHRLASNT